MPTIDLGNLGSVEMALETLLARETCTPRERTVRQSRDVRSGDIARAIEGEIIPRLVMARRTAGHGGDGPGALSLNEGHVEQLARLLVAQEVGVPLAYVRELMDEGASLGAIYRDLLAPAARRMGELWSEDHCSFFEVTVGLCALHQVLHSLSREASRTDVSDAGDGKRVLLTPAPGEQHTFGLMMVGDAFRRAGWDVRFEAPETSSDLARLLRQESFDLLGLSVGCDTPLKGVSRAIQAARRSSAHRGIGVMVGGALINSQPELVARLGADASAKDGPSAVAQAEHVVKLLSART